MSEKYLELVRKREIYNHKYSFTVSVPFRAEMPFFFTQDEKY